jgi:hypothetical protein
MIRSRRSFIAGACALAGCNSMRPLAQPIGENPSYTDKVAADKWIMQWMQSPRAATEPLHLGRFADRMYFLLKQIGWKPNPGQNAMPVRVPVGFVTDFASIPRVFWTLLPPDGLYTYPAILHDYLYWQQDVNREQADEILKFAMADFKVDPVTSETIFRGVRLGGEAAWSENAALKKSGEKRILKSWPTDPTIQWKDWKKRPVF